MIKIIKFLGIWIILALAVFVGGRIGDATLDFLVETFGVLNAAWGIFALSIGGALAFVAWQITEET